MYLSAKVVMTLEEVNHGPGLKILAAGVSSVGVLMELRLFSVVFLLTILTMTWELITCWWATPHRTRGEFDWARVIGGKLIVLSLIVPAMALDWLVIFGAEHIRGFASPLAPYMPVTVTSLVWIIVAQALQGIQNVRHAEGDENVPRILIWALHQIRKRDERRYPFEGVPMRRWWDDLTEEQVEAILSERKKGDK